jgi:DNA polymerase elongation subunit (family B)
MDLGISQRAEDAEYAKEHNIPIDVLYYIKNQVITPLVTLLQLYYKQAESDILNHTEIAQKMVTLQALTSRLIQKSKRVRTNATNKQREITSFFKRDP